MFYRTCFKKSCTWVYNKICAKYILDAVFCSYTWITHVTVCAQNEQEIPWSSQQQLAHNSCWEKQSFDRLLFLCLFGLFTPSYECICDRFHQRQCCDSRAGIFKWNFDHFLLETVKWEGIWSNVWLPYTVNMQDFVQYLHRFQIGFFKKSQFTAISPNNLFHLMKCHISCSSL